MGEVKPTSPGETDDEQNLEDFFGELLGHLESGTRLDGPYSASVFESQGSVQTTIPTESRERSGLDIDDLGTRDQYVAPDHGLLIIDLGDNYSR